MSEEQKPPTSIVDELRLLGQQLGAAAKALWNSEESHAFRQQVREGLSEASQQIDGAVKSFEDSAASQQFGAQVKHGLEKARESDVGKEVEAGIVSGLQEINRQLGQFLSNWSSRPPTGSPPPPPAPPSEPGDSA